VQTTTQYLFVYFCCCNFFCAIVSYTTIYALSAWEAGAGKYAFQLDKYLSLHERFIL